MEQNPEAFLAKQLEALYASGETGENKVMEIAAGAGTSAISNVSGGLTGTTIFDAAMADGVHTKSDNADTESNGHRADSSEHLGGPAHEVDQREVEKARRFALLKTDPSQTVEKIDPTTLQSMGEVKDPHKT